MRKVVVFETADTMARYSAEMLREELSGVTAGIRHSLALSGGSTPRRMYEAFTQVNDAGRLARDHAEFFFSDERAVGPDSEQSNFRTANEGLFRPLGVDESRIHRMRGEAPDLEAEAVRYEEEIRGIVTTRTGDVPSFDLIFLGMGPDGHTASLFPDYDFEGESPRLVAAPYAQTPGARRLTFTLRLINAARKVVFLVTGREKGGAVTNVLSGGKKGDILPAGRVAAATTIWLLDREAAQELDRAEIDGIRYEC